MGWWCPAAGLGALNVAVHTWDLSNPGIKCDLLHWQASSLPYEPQGIYVCVCVCVCVFTEFVTVLDLFYALIFLATKHVGS